MLSVIFVISVLLSVSKCAKNDKDMGPFHHFVQKLINYNTEGAGRVRSTLVCGQKSEFITLLQEILMAKTLS